MNDRRWYDATSSEFAMQKMHILCHAFSAADEEEKQAF